MVFEHPNPRRASHQVIVLPINWQDGFDVFSEDLRRLIQTHSLMREGYTIFVQFDSMPEGCGLVLHLVSGSVMGFSSWLCFGMIMFGDSWGPSLERGLAPAPFCWLLRS